MFEEKHNSITDLHEQDFCFFFVKKVGMTTLLLGIVRSPS